MTKQFKKQVRILSFSIITITCLTGLSYVTYQKLYGKKPSYSTYLDRGNEAFTKGNYQEAVTCYNQARALNPKSPSVNFNLGLTWLKLGEKNDDYKQAVSYFRAAYSLNPNAEQIMTSLANALLMSGELDEAITIFKKVLLNNPQSYAAHIGIGQSLERKNNVTEAIPYYKKAIEINPDLPNAHVALAGSYFFIGNYEEGFKEYEHRWNMTNLPEETKKIKWDGANPKGKKIFLIGENGLGDIIQFIRFARQLKEKEATVSVMVQEPLMNLFAQCDYIDEVLPRRTRPDCDEYTLLQSLPYLFKTTEQSLPTPPYLKADQTLVTHWKEQLKDDPNFKVGICWMSGGDKGHVPQGKRSIPLKLFEPLAHIEGVSFYSLYRGEGENQLQDLPKTFVVHSFDSDFDTKHGGFMDTAALMMNLDLIITIDTSVAHLAGALAVPTWTLLPFTPDPRWMLERTDTPWYPTMYLFRQSSPGRWDIVIENVKTKLADLVQKKH